MSDPHPAKPPSNDGVPADPASPVAASAVPGAASPPVDIQTSPAIPTEPKAGAAPLDLDHEAALLIRREFSHRKALNTLVGMGFPRDQAAAALDTALAPLRARRRVRVLRFMAMLTVSLLIAAGAVWWHPGVDQSPRALGFHLALDLGWLWVGFGGLSMVRWFIRHHGILILVVGLVRPVRTLRKIVMETDSDDLSDLEPHLITLAAGIALVVFAHHFGQGPGTIIYVDPR